MGGVKWCVGYLRGLEKRSQISVLGGWKNMKVEGGDLFVVKMMGKGGNLEEKEEKKRGRWKLSPGSETNGNTDA